MGRHNKFVMVLVLAEEEVLVLAEEVEVEEVK
jgi:hypothetical protein